MFELSLAIVETHANQSVINQCQSFVKVEARSGFEKQTCDYDVLTCMDCEDEMSICQEGVEVASDEEKKALAAFDENGACMICPGRCPSSRHTIG